MAQLLRDQGYRAYALQGGLAGWRRAGYPTEPKAVERERTVEDVCPDCGQPMDAHGMKYQLGSLR
ncbi:MAG: rhodanese-like domain-containing protein [Chloroflexota bacterium]